MKAKTFKLYPNTALLLLRDDSLDKNKKNCQKFFTDNQEKYLNHFATYEKMTINKEGGNKDMEKQLEEFKKKLDENKEIKNICLFIDTHNVSVNSKGQLLYKYIKINHELLEKILSFLKDTKYNIHIQLAACTNACNIKKQNKPVDIKEILKQQFKGHSGKIIFSTFSNNDQFLRGRYNDNGMYRATLRRNTKKGREVYDTGDLQHNYILDKTTNEWCQTRIITPYEQDVAIWYRQPKKTVNSRPVLRKKLNLNKRFNKSK